MVLHSTAGDATVRPSGGVAAAIRHLMVVNQAVLPAMTIVPAWPRRHGLISFYHDNSENSDVADELSTGHSFTSPARRSSMGAGTTPGEEDEAAWLAGCLLVPRDAALVVAKSGLGLHIAAAQCGVSTRLDGPACRPRHRGLGAAGAPEAEPLGGAGPPIPAPGATAK